MCSAIHVWFVWHLCCTVHLYSSVFDICIRHNVFCVSSYAGAYSDTHSTKYGSQAAELSTNRETSDCTNIIQNDYRYYVSSHVSTPATCASTTTPQATASKQPLPCTYTNFTICSINQLPPRQHYVYKPIPIKSCLHPLLRTQLDHHTVNSGF